MTDTTPTPIRVLVVDDEPEIRDSYRQILQESEASLEMTGFHELRSRLFRKNPMGALRARAAISCATRQPTPRASRSRCSGSSASV